MWTRFWLELYQRLWLAYYYTTTFEISAIWWHLLEPFHNHASYTNNTQLCIERCMNGPHVDFFFFGLLVVIDLPCCKSMWTNLDMANVPDRSWTMECPWESVRDAWMSKTGRWTNTWRYVSLHFLWDFAGIFLPTQRRVFIFTFPLGLPAYSP